MLEYLTLFMSPYVILETFILSQCNENLTIVCLFSTYCVFVTITISVL